MSELQRTRLRPWRSFVYDAVLLPLKHCTRWQRHTDAAVSHALLLSRDYVADCLAGGGATNAHPPGHSSRYAYVRYTDLEYGSTDSIGSALESDYILRVLALAAAARHAPIKRNQKA
jgi:hypothetical protein